MNRTKQHQIDTAASKLFQNIIPNDWVVRDQQVDDYGIDYELEIFKNDHSTGMILKVQLKGTETIKTIEDDKKLTYSFSMSNLNYYLNEIHIPIIIVIVDIINEVIYWYNPQLDESLRTRFDIKKCTSQQSLTVYIDTSQQLPNDLGNLEYEYIKSMHFISARFLSDQNNVRYESITSLLDNDIDVINEFQNKVDLLKIEKAIEFITESNFDQARSLLESLFGTNETSVQTKFRAIMLEESIEISKAYLANAVKDQFQAIHLRYAHILNKFSKNTPMQLRIYAITNLATHQLNQLVRDEMTYYLNFKMNKDDNDLLWLTTIYAERVKFIRKIQVKFFQIRRLINIALIEKQYTIIPDLFIKFIQPVGLYIQRLRDEGLDDASKILVNDFLVLGQLVIEIAKANKNKEQLSGLVFNLLLLRNFSNPDEQSDFQKSIFEMLNPIEKETIEFIENDVNKLIQRSDNYSSSKTETDEEIEMYENMARVLGINLSDKNDDIAKVVNIGINDLNPGRILKNCESLFVKLKGGGKISEWMKLPTAGFKALICTKHKHKWEGMSLDDLYILFENDHCKNCVDKKSLPENWSWSREWQLEQNKKYRKQFEE